MECTLPIIITVAGYYICLNVCSLIIYNFFFIITISYILVYLCTYLSARFFCTWVVALDALRFGLFKQ